MGGAWEGGNNGPGAHLLLLGHTSQRIYLSKMQNVSQNVFLCDLLNKFLAVLVGGFGGGLGAKSF